MIENNEYDVPPNSISPERAPRVSDSEQRAVVDHIRKNNELTECLKNKTSLADTHGKSTHITETERKFAQVIVTSADTSFLYGMFFNTPKGSTPKNGGMDHAEQIRTFLDAVATQIGRPDDDPLKDGEVTAISKSIRARLMLRQAGDNGGSKFSPVYASSPSEQFSPLNQASRNEKKPSHWRRRLRNGVVMVASVGILADAATGDS